MRRALFLVITDCRGGSERVAFSLASELAGRPGWDVEVKIICAQLADSFSRDLLSPSVRVSYGPFSNWYLAFPLLPLRLIFRRYDLVFTTFIYTNALLSMMRRLGLIGVRLLIARESMQLFDWFGGLKARLFRWLYRTYGGEDLIIAQTSYMADHVRPWLPKRSATRLRVLPNPVNVEAVSAGASLPLEPDVKDRLVGPNLLFCGKLVEIKRPLAALNAFEELVKSGLQSQLVFLGSGPLEAELRAEALQRGLQNRVLFLEERANPFAIMASCQYGLITSAREGFPNVVLEMMASRLRKIVMTPCAGDLDRLPDVAVTRTFDDHELAALLGQAIQSGEDHGESYRKFAATRSVGAYLDAFLDMA